MAVLTREREISTCPHHIPALALNSTHLLSENWSRIVSPLLPKPAATQRGSLQMLWMWNPGDRWLQSGYTIQTKRETACGIPGISNLSLLNYLTPKLQKVTHRNEVGGERGGRTGGRANNSLTLRHDTVSRRKNTVTALHDEFTWARFNPTRLLPHVRTDESYSTSVRQTTTSLCCKNGVMTVRSTTTLWLFIDFQIVQEPFSIQSYCILASPLNPNLEQVCKPLKWLAK